LRDHRARKIKKYKEKPGKGRKGGEKERKGRDWRTPTPFPPRNNFLVTV